MQIELEDSCLQWNKPTERLSEQVDSLETESKSTLFFIV